MSGFNTDYFIIGQGLAGTFISHHLQLSGRSITVLDNSRPGAASRVAPGLFHPITGRRLVKGWMVDELHEYAIRYYSLLEKELAVRVFYQMDAIEIASTAKEYNDWSSRMQDSEYIHFFKEEAPEEQFKSSLKPFKKLIRVSNSGRIDIQTLLENYRNKLKRNNQFLEGDFDETKLQQEGPYWKYEEKLFKRVIFCQGFYSSTSSFWNWLPMNPAKGELLTIYAKDLPQDFLIIHSLFLAPIGDGKFKAGATYAWDDLLENITSTAREKLEKQLDALLKIPYTILDQSAGIRPATRDRRPFLGEHPLIRGLFIFNGLGTKGVQLGPYFANHLVDHLENKTALNSEVDIKRAYHLFFERSQSSD